MNIVVLRGRLSRPVEERELPSGDRLSVLDLTIKGEGEERSESVPLAWFGAPAWVGETEVGEELVIAGRVRRRFFRGGSGLQSRTEVVVESGAPARRPARAASVVERAVRSAMGGQGSTASWAAAPGVPGVPAAGGRRRRRAPATFPD